MSASGSVVPDVVGEDGERRTDQSDHSVRMATGTAAVDGFTTLLDAGQYRIIGAPDGQ